MAGDKIMECNICGCNDFVSFRNRGLIRCSGCGSIERTRLLAMFLEKYAPSHTGARVLHLAPERPLFNKLAKVYGDGYHVRDLDVQRYTKFRYEGVMVKKLDLCNDLESLPTDYYDLVLHNHVLEHLPCNVTAVLWHLHRTLKSTGVHMFSIPMSKHYEESFAEMKPEERDRRFNHPEHIRIFGRKDLESTIGMIFDIKEQIKKTPCDHFGNDTLEQYNIPESRRNKFDGASLFVIPKSGLKLV